MKVVFRDYRTGQFVSHETYNRSRAQGGSDIVKEKLEPSDAIRSFEDLQYYEDYDGELEVYEIQGTGDTGQRE